jgi:hypothetical protein
LEDCYADELSLVSGDLEDIENKVVILMRKLGYQLLQRLVSKQRNYYKGVLDNVKINEQGLVDIYSACDGLGVQTSYERYINYRKMINEKETVPGFPRGTWIIEKPGKSMRMSSVVKKLFRKTL